MLQSHGHPYLMKHLEIWAEGEGGWCQSRCMQGRQAIIIPLISSRRIIVVPSEYFHNTATVDNEQGLVCVCVCVWGKIWIPMDHLVLARFYQFSRSFLLKIFHTGNCEQFRRSHNFSSNSHNSIDCTTHECWNWPKRKTFLLFQT